MTKYRSRKTTVDGITFDSKLEATRYLQLRLLAKAGEISQLQLQVEFQILRGWVNPGIICEDGLDTDGDVVYTIYNTPEKAGEKIKSRFYVADFVYYDTKLRMWIVEDTKGVETPEFRLKWDMVRTQYPRFVFRKIKREDM